MASAKIKFTTPVLTVSYPNYNSPDTDGQYADGKFKGKCSGPLTDPKVAAFKAQVLEAAKELGVAKKGNTMPLTALKDDNDELTGYVQINAKSKFAPAIVDARGKPVNPAKVKIGTGSTIRVQGFFEAYQDGKGMSARLTGVQIVNLVEPNDQSSADFDAVEGGYSADDDDIGFDIGTSDDDAWFDVNSVSGSVDTSEDDGDGGELDI
ncbi:DUF2815 family protein [Polymorphobacter arshaanensis]|uniref:DUF2815 family protein n=1 Tax=Glacieibacterium arshaanense TaxID=2511025 RepID=A0A4Y9ER81_9SPHN|nr:ssDNA-binding protein [Polymorphobacter arshaanensis]TFU06141.1 DUF2815 family protein [Polymorphobacter arshaanensis]